MRRAAKNQRPSSNIRDYFRTRAQDKPQTPNSSSPPLPPTHDIPSSPLPGSQSSLPILSSPHKPLENAPSRPAYSRDAVIAGSDDEGDSSEDEFASLEQLLSVKPRPISPPPVHRSSVDPCVTPDAKRRFSPIYRSPVSMQPRVRFDIGALLKHAKKDDATDEGFRRVTNLEDEIGNTTETVDQGTPNATLRGSLAKAVEHQEDHQLDKVVRAVSRTDVTTRRITYHFFLGPEEQPPKQGLPRFPKRDVQKLPAFTGVSRPEDLDYDLVLIIAGLNRLPDSLFMWLFENATDCTASSRTCESVASILALCPNQVAKLITPQYLETVFQRLGATPDISIHSSVLKVTTMGTERYKNRDWRPLRVLLSVLSEVSPLLSLETSTYLTAILLRLAVDRELLQDISVLTNFQTLFHSLVTSIPDQNWESYCSEICTSLFDSFVGASLRLHPLRCISTTNPRLHDLRRRLAAVSLFNDLSLANQPLDDALPLFKFIELFQTLEFQTTPKTDYIELRARIALLDIAVDMASRPRKDRNTPLVKAKADETSFNKQVDALVYELKRLSRGINDTGMRSMFPTEAKGEIEWVIGRLSGTVRTRPEPRKSIFDSLARHKEDEALPRQQEYLKSFLNRSSKS